MNIINETEEEIAKFTGFKHCILCNSGTAALHTIYNAYDIEDEDCVITTPFTYYSTCNMLLANRASISFADINKDDYLINPDEVRKLVDKYTKAIVAVNLFGKEVDYDKLKYDNIPLIIDSCQCFKPGIKGDCIAFSFQRSKNINCGEGGCICTNSDKIATRCRIIINQGEYDKYCTIDLGYNYRISDYQALIIYNQVKYHQIAILSELGRYSIKNGHYPFVVYEQPLYKRLGYYDIWKGKCPNAEMIAKEVREKYWCKK